MEAPFLATLSKNFNLGMGKKIFILFILYVHYLIYHPHTNRWTQLIGGGGGNKLLNIIPYKKEVKKQKECVELLKQREGLEKKGREEDWELQWQMPACHLLPI